MDWIKYSFGDLLEQTHEENSELKYGPEDVRGMTITKEIIDTKARTEYADLQKFIIVHPNEFIYNPRTHGKKIGLGYNNTDKSFLISWNNIAFKIKDEAINIVDPEYLYLHFIRPEWDREACYRALGSSTEVFAWETFERMTIFLPTLEEQKDVVKKIKVITDRIKVLTEINKKLEEIAFAVYKSWFIYFEPFGGVMPTNWKYQTLLENDLTTIIETGISKFEGEKVYLPTGCIQDNKIVDMSNIVTYKNRESRANMQPVENSVWFAKMKATKKALYFGDYSADIIKNVILSTGLLGLKCKIYALEYIWNFIYNTDFEIVKDRLAHGTTQEAINNLDLARVQLLIPSEDVLKKFSESMYPIYKNKYCNKIEIQKLTELKDVLLPKLMTGDIN